MALSDILNLSSRDQKKIGISEERLEPIKPYIRQYIAYWREYPDMFIDFLQTGLDGEVPENGLRFYFYQRCFLRVCMRYKYVYMVFPRACVKMRQCENNFLFPRTNFLNCGNSFFNIL